MGYVTGGATDGNFDVMEYDGKAGGVIWRAGNGESRLNVVAVRGIPDRDDAAILEGGTGDLHVGQLKALGESLAYAEGNEGQDSYK